MENRFHMLVRWCVCVSVGVYYVPIRPPTIVSFSVYVCTVCVCSVKNFCKLKKFLIESTYCCMKTIGFVRSIDKNRVSIVFCWCISFWWYFQHCPTKDGQKTKGVLPIQTRSHERVDMQLLFWIDSRLGWSITSFSHYSTFDELRVFAIGECWASVAQCAAIVANVKPIEPNITDELSQ